MPEDMRSERDSYGSTGRLSASLGKTRKPSLAIL
jgi:hypothetical protein